MVCSVLVVASDISDFHIASGKMKIASCRTRKVESGNSESNPLRWPHQAMHALIGTIMRYVLSAKV